MSCADLYRHEATFRAGIEAWVYNLRCPVELGDYLEERDLPDAAECARWAHSAPERPLFEGVLVSEETQEGVTGGVFPEYYPDPEWWGVDSTEEGPYWYWAWNDENDGLRSRTGRFNTPQEAIVWLLDNWKSPKAEGGSE